MSSLIVGRTTAVGIASFMALLGLLGPAPDVDGISVGDPGLHAVVVPVMQATLSAPIEGALSEILVSEGEVVKKGQILARTDDTVARAMVQSAKAAVGRKASIEYAQFEIDLSRSYLKRLEATGRVGATTDAAYEEARAKLNKAKASYDLVVEQGIIAQRNLELELARLESHVLRAPFAGRIGRISARVGETKGKTDPVLHLVSLQRLETELHLPAARYHSLEIGQTFRLEASAPVSRVIEGTLRVIDPIIDPVTRSVRCVFEIPNPDESLPAGFTVQFADSQN